MHIIRRSNDTHVYNDIQVFYLVFLKQSCTLHVLVYITSHNKRHLFSVSVSDKH